MIEETPILIERKSFREDSGGSGQFRGGNGQSLVIRVINETPLTVSFLSDRNKIPAPGFAGGHDGALGAVMLNGKPINPKETVIVQPGDVIALNTPGGAGYGEPQQRERERVSVDVATGMVSEKLAHDVYQWAAG